MVILEKKNVSYYIKEESVIVEYNNQFISYNVYSLQNRKRFKDFKQSLIESTTDEYSTINELMSLAMRYGLKGMVGRRPQIEVS